MCPRSAVTESLVGAVSPVRTGLGSHTELLLLHCVRRAVTDQQGPRQDRLPLLGMEGLVGLGSCQPFLCDV